MSTCLDCSLEMGSYCASICMCLSWVSGVSTGNTDMPEMILAPILIQPEKFNRTLLLQSLVVDDGCKPIAAPLQRNFLFFNAPPTRFKTDDEWGKKRKARHVNLKIKLSTSQRRILHTSSQLTPPKPPPLAASQCRRRFHPQEAIRQSRHY